MKKISITIILLIGIVCSEAGADWGWERKIEKGPTFGFELGAGMTSVTHKIRTATISTSDKEGFVFGLEGQIGMSRRFLISLGSEYYPLHKIRSWGRTPSLGEYTEEEGISLWPLNAGFRYHPPLYLGRRLRIFIIGGVICNIAHYYLRASYAGGSLTRWGYNLGQYCGGGIEYFWMRRSSIALSYRYNFGKSLDLGYSGYTIRVDPNYVSGRILLNSYFGRTPEMKKKRLRTKKEKIRIGKEISREEKVEIMKEHYKKATNYYKKGKYEKAIKEWEKVLEIDPNHKNSKICLEKARKKLKEK